VPDPIRAGIDARLEACVRLADVVEGGKRGQPGEVLRGQRPPGCRFEHRSPCAAYKQAFEHRTHVEKVVRERQGRPGLSVQLGPDNGAGVHLFDPLHGAARWPVGMPQGKASSPGKNKRALPPFRRNR